jgi:hypothetical protein
MPLVLICTSRDDIEVEPDMVIVSAYSHEFPTVTLMPSVHEPVGVKDALN